MPNSIKNLAEFISRAVELSHKSDREYFWRGHSDSNYKLVPNIYRKTTKLSDKEHLLLKEAVIRHSEEFSSRRSYFEKLSLMQHYDFPTRLLDVTENPLVALYFACKSDARSTRNGEVILIGVKSEQVKYGDSDSVSVLSTLSCVPPQKFNDFNQELKNKILASADSSLRTIKTRLNQNINQSAITTLTNYLDNIKGRSDTTRALLLKIFNECALIDYLVYEIRAEKPHFRNAIWPEHFNNAIACVKSKHDNQRIAAQQGAFLIFGIKNGDKSLPAAFQNNDILEYRIEIDHGSKKEILKTLARFGVSEERLFPELITSAKVIKEKLKIPK